uniref:Alpha/beta hydrolase fold protein n=1 Tax=Tanacetum cinerariifolium TaxID=118510 RepID=A0A6L2LNP2_TANCI|nr:alpha/beta hydrolase fold protein [Tanacetum cinerariifolium]
MLDSLYNSTVSHLEADHFAIPRLKLFISRIFNKDKDPSLINTRTSFAQESCTKNKCIARDDIKSLEDLNYEKRKQFLSQHKLPKGIPLISFPSEANVGPGVISMMSHIAHMELLKLSFLGNTSDESEYESDGLVTGRDAEVPGSVVVHPNQKLDHSWMVYSSWNKNQAWADASEMYEALLTMLVELGLRDFRYKGDIKSLEDLTYEKRKQFLIQHKLPNGIPLISFCFEANVGPWVISTMSHIAHVELLKLSFMGNMSDESEYEVGPAKKHRVPLVVPVSAVMALSALHLQLRYGEKSDGLVTFRDAEVPSSVVVRPNQKLEYAWMVYSSWNKNQAGADASEMYEAFLTMLVELGKEDNSGS